MGRPQQIQDVIDRLQWLADYEYPTAQEGLHTLVVYVTKLENDNMEYLAWVNSLEGCPCRIDTTDTCIKCR